MTANKVQYDPESLLTGAEVKAGLTYKNSSRVWPSVDLYRRSVRGELSTEEVLTYAPRQLRMGWQGTRIHCSN